MCEPLHDSPDESFHVITIVWPMTEAEAFLDVLDDVTLKPVSEAPETEYVQ